VALVGPDLGVEVEAEGVAAVRDRLHVVRRRRRRGRDHRRRAGRARGAGRRGARRGRRRRRRGAGGGGRGGGGVARRGGEGDGGEGERAEDSGAHGRALTTARARAHYRRRTYTVAGGFAGLSVFGGRITTRASARARSAWGWVSNWSSWRCASTR